MKRPKTSIFDYEEASDLSRAICDEPRNWPKDPSWIHTFIIWIGKASAGTWYRFKANWGTAHGANR